MKILLSLIVLPLAIVAFAPTPASAEDGASDKVLRHAVFFSFKDSSSEADVQGVVDAFKALPGKIDTIIDFQSGKITPGKMADGFTHAFLLTFKDEAGREVYLPHPEHKAFGAVLGPHMKDVFVVDYWGQASDAKVDSPLRHMVFFDFKDDASKADVSSVEETFAGLADKIDTIKDFEWGTNNSPETHDDGFTHCFTVTFSDAEGLAAYNPHPEHQALVKMLGIVEKVRVIDFTAQ